jgi:hypothetical protein
LLFPVFLIFIGPIRDLAARAAGALF